MTLQTSLDSAVVDQGGKPTQELQRLLELTGVQHDGSLSDIVQNLPECVFVSPIFCLKIAEFRVHCTFCFIF